MARWNYRYAGLSVAAELYLPEWQPFASAVPSPSPDVEICLEETLTEAQPWRLTADEYCFTIEGIGQYRIQAGRVIRIALYPNAGLREVRLFLLGSAWGALCYQRGLLALHASVVEGQGQAMAFCGISGAGKSSLAAWLVAHGYRLVGDDLCHVDLNGSEPRVYPAVPRLKLWGDALTELGWEMDGLERDHFRMDKFHIGADKGLFPLPKNATDEPLPLCAIYLLAWGEAKIVRLTGLAALSQFIKAATYRGELLEPMGALAAHWQRCAALARNVPIFRFTRPADWPAMAAAVHLLIDSWQAESGKNALRLPES